MINASVWGVEETSRLAEKLVLNTRLALEAAGGEVGEFLRDTIRLHIQEQDLDWPALSPSTIAKKNNDERAWIDTGFLYQNIALSAQRQGNVMHYRVGLPANLVHPISQLPVALIAAWNEFGTANAPPRPLFRPAVQEVKEHVRSKFATFFQDGLMSAWKGKPLKSAW